MIKKIILGVIAILVALGIGISVAVPHFLGFSVVHLGHAVQVASSLTAKLACSARYISGFDKNQIVNDVASYSPATKLVELTFDDDNKTVHANLYGMAQTSARFHAATGCSLLLKDANKLADIAPETLTESNAPWPTGDHVASIDQRVQSELEAIIAKDNQQGLNSRAMLVIKNGEIVAEAYAQQTNETTPLLGWSMAKSVTAMMIGRMEQLQRVDGEQANLFAAWQNDERRALTLNNLLTMSSGLAFDETYAPGSDATHMLFTAYSASDVALKSALEHPIDSHFSYSSGTTNLLNRYIYQTFDNSTAKVNEFLYEQLFNPLGMQNSVFETDSSGVLVGSSYLYASGRDWARLGLLMLNNGKVGDNQLLSADWVSRAQAANHSDNDKRYGYQFWLNSAEDHDLRWHMLPEDAYGMSGNRQQSVMIFPSDNTVIVRLGWTKGDYPMQENFSRLLTSVNNI